MSKSVRHITRLKRVSPLRAIDAQALIAKSDSIPPSVRLDILEAVEEAAIDKVRAKGLSEDVILGLAKRRIDFGTLARALDGAQSIVRSPQLYRLEIDAENYLRTLTPSAKPNKIGFKPPGGTQRGTAGYRYPDIYDKDAKQAIEVKNGYIRLGKDDFIKKQVEKDAALIAAGGEIRSVTWHFFPNSKGRVGLSDELRQLLQDNQIPYVIHIP